MILDDIRNGTRVFLDANVLIYGIRRSSAQCRGLLVRCDSGSIRGVISTVVLAEVGYRRMIEEARAKGLVAGNPARALAQRPELIHQLGGYAEEVRDLLGGGFAVEPVQPDDFHLALEFQRQFGLLTNDSLNLAVARRLNITEIATTDRVFDSVQGFIIYQPGDLPVPPNHVST